MSIIYHGNIEEIKREFTEVEEALKARYLEVLGIERVQKLEEVTRKTLNSYSFFDDTEKFYKITGNRIKGANKFIVATTQNLEVNGSGKIKERKANTAPVFYISEQGFQQSGSAQFTEKRVASYVHEYDHFVWYALQRVPIYLITLGMNQNIEGKNEPEELFQLIYDMHSKGASRQQLIDTFAFGLHCHILQDAYEKANRILDKMILKSIGIDLELPFRGKRKIQMPLSIPYADAAALVIIGGDPYWNLTDEQVINNFIEWETYLNLGIQSKYVQTFLQSVKELKVSKIPFSHMKAEMDRYQTKKRRK